MFQANQTQDTRVVFFETWKKHQNHQPLTPLEASVLEVILAHPEYHDMLTQSANIEKPYFPALGQENPFLHMGLHIAIREQVSTNRPNGIQAIFQQLTTKYPPLEAEHCMMQCLADCLWSAQKNNSMPNESTYISQLKQII